MQERQTYIGRSPLSRVPHPLLMHESNPCARWAGALAAHADSMHLSVHCSEPVSGLSTLLLLFGGNHVGGGLLRPTLGLAAGGASPTFSGVSSLTLCHGLHWDRLGLGGPTLASALNLRFVGDS